MKKYVLTLTEEQAKAVRSACEFFTRVRCGQFMEIIYHCLSHEGGDVLSRRETKCHVTDELIGELRMIMGDVDGSEELLSQLAEKNYMRPGYSGQEQRPMGYSERREYAEKILFLARTFLMPELKGIGHSHGIGFSDATDLSFDVYQALRYAMAEEKKNVVPFSYHTLPICEEVEE